MYAKVNHSSGKQSPSESLLVAKRQRTSKTQRQEIIVGLAKVLKSLTVQVMSSILEINEPSL